ncbi:MAG: hypothetical protein ACRECC_03360 [Pseudolabrys sp.]|jgi:hypothetical protein
MRVDNRAAYSGVIAGLVPAIPIHWLYDLIIKITPFGVGLRNETTFPSARPMLDVLFSLNGLIRGRVNLELDELVDTVSFRMASHQSILIFVDGE